MKLYYGAGSCSLGIHVLLEELGAPFEAVAVDLRAGEQYKEGFSAVNPKHKVPTLLRDDGSILTEYQAIAWWLAASHPAAGLLPSELEGQVRALERMDYIVATIHMQGFGRLFRPSNFTPNAADEDNVRARGQQLVATGFELINGLLAEQDYLVNRFSIADTALFYVSFWAAGRMKIALPPRCDAHYQRMLARPAVQRAMASEGLTP